MKVFRTLLCIPIVNIFLFTFMPRMAYREFFLGYIESHGKTLEEVWELATERERKILCEFNIYDGNKREEDGTTSPISGQGNQEGADTGGISKTD